MRDLLCRYGVLLDGVNAWFARSLRLFPDEIRCGEGCSACCRGLFDITLLDAFYLREGFDRLPDEVRQVVLARARARLRGLQAIWPEFDHPYILNLRPEEEWGMLMPDDDETPCVLLGTDGRCLVYEHRPMTCRLHGLPLVDLAGEVMHDEWCTENFVGRNPLYETELRGEFQRMFEEEVVLFRELTSYLFNRCLNELDTFIPAALLIDFTGFDWRRWGARARLVENP